MTTDTIAPYSLSQIAQILGVDAPKAEGEIKVLLTDSRSLTYAEQSLFFAIATPTNDGHKYIRSLYDRGVRAFVATHIPDDMKDSPCSDACFFIVDDVTKALQRLATHHRHQFNLPVIAITGSRGKTTVKEWLYQLLAPDFSIERSPRSYNSQIGVPLSIWGLNHSTQLGIFEAGISRCGEMELLRPIIAPTIGIITNLGNPHAEGFVSPQQKCDEKLKLFTDVEHLIYNADSPIIREAIERSPYRGQRIGWSTTDPYAKLFVSNITTDDDTSTSFDYVYEGRIKGSITIPFTTKTALEDAIHCLALMLLLSRDTEVIAQRMKTLTPVGTRMDVVEGVNNCLLIHDTYTSDLNSLEPALDFMCRRRTALRTTTIILSDLMHEMADPEPLYQSAATLLRRKEIDRIIAVGEEMKRYAHHFGANAQVFSSLEEMMALMSPSDFDHELILVKGAPHFGFEALIDMLEARQHETVLEVSLDALVSNFNLFRSKLLPSTGIVCMVKASGYGAGSYELAKTLQSQGAAYMAVAVVDEGVELRQAGITMPIMVLNPKVVNYRALFSHHLEPEIFNINILHEIIREGKKWGVNNYPVHLKLDTGMHRLGFIESELPEVIEILKNQDIIRLESIFSHLAAADDPAMDDYTEEQFRCFSRCYDILHQGIPYPFKRHILNSTGITRFPQYQYDMVRLGICLYGVKTMDDGSQDGLRPVSRLSTVIISIRHWPAGTTIGYNRRGLLTRPSLIATIPVGYADGIDRHLGCGAMKVLVNGHRCPTVGNICMDACMIDVTDVPSCKEGDRVEIFGDSVAVTELSDTLHTIPYEILTSVSERVKRVYYRD